MYYPFTLLLWQPEPCTPQSITGTNENLKSGQGQAMAIPRHPFFTSVECTVQAAKATA